MNNSCEAVRGGPQTVGVIVLAGDRGSADPVARAHAVPSKALVPVAGVAMLTRVLDAVARLEEAGPLVLVAPPRVELDAAAAASAYPPEWVRRVIPAVSPSRSLALAFDALSDKEEVLLVTADHPLLEAAWLCHLLEEGRRGAAELAVALVPWETVAKHFPGSHRTRYRFRNGAFCGTNLFLFRGLRARRIAELWQRVEAQRKHPWRILSLLGPGNLLRYLLGRMTLGQALERLSQRLGFAVDAVLLDAPESAVDVDSRADLRCVEAVFAAREAADAPD